MIPHITAMIHADTALVGWATGGEMPSVWLQNHLYDPLHAQWYDVAISVVYFSHFVAAPIVAAVLWFRNRTAWLSFVRRWFTLFALGLVTYFVYPAMPPWLAAQTATCRRSSMVSRPVGGMRSAWRTAATCSPRRSSTPPT